MHNIGSWGLGVGALKVVLPTGTSGVFDPDPESVTASYCMPVAAQVYCIVLVSLLGLNCQPNIHRHFVACSDVLLHCIATGRCYLLVLGVVRRSMPSYCLAHLAECID